MLFCSAYNFLKCTLSLSESLRTQTERRVPTGPLPITLHSCSVVPRATTEHLSFRTERCSPDSLRIQWLETTPNPPSCPQLQNSHMILASWAISAFSWFPKAKLHRIWKDDFATKKLLFGNSLNLELEYSMCSGSKTLHCLTTGHWFIH